MNKKSFKLVNEEDYIFYLSEIIIDFIAYKNRTHLNLKIEDLPEEERKILNLFHNHRNWGLHILESLMVQKKDFLKIDNKFINKHKKCYYCT